MKPTVYIETTVVSYLTARPTRDPVMAGWIAESKRWWQAQRPHFDLVVSDAVLREASLGDATAAQRRLTALADMRMLSSGLPAERLAEFFLSNLAMPAKAADDALHVAIAATNAVDFLLTWNCRHIANAAMRPRLEGLCLAAGFRCPIIATPSELIALEHED